MTFSVLFGAVVLTIFLQDYDSDDLKGKSKPSFSLDRALRAHKIHDDGIELQDRAHLKKRNGTLDDRDPMVIAGGEGKYVDMEIANSKDADIVNSRNSKGNLKKRIGSLRRNKDD